MYPSTPLDRSDRVNFPSWEKVFEVVRDHSRMNSILEDHLPELHESRVQSPDETGIGSLDNVSRHDFTVDTLATCMPTPILSCTVEDACSESDSDEDICEYFFRASLHALDLERVNLGQGWFLINMAPALLCSGPAADILRTPQRQGAPFSSMAARVRDLLLRSRIDSPTASPSRSEASSLGLYLADARASALGSPGASVLVQGHKHHRSGIRRRAPASPLLSRSPLATPQASCEADLGWAPLQDASKDPIAAPTLGQKAPKMAVEEGLRADTDGAGSCTQQERHSGGQQAPQDVRSWGHGEEAGEGEGVGSPPMWEFYRYFQLGGLVDKEGQGLPASPAATQCHKHSVQRSVGAFPPASPPKQHLGACLDQECRTLAPVPTLGAWAPLAVEQEDGDPLGCCVFARSRGTERSTPSAHGMSASLRLSRIESLASDRSGDMPRELPEELEGGAAGMVSTSMGADAPGGVREPSQVLAAGSAHKRFRRASSRASDGHAAPVLPDTDESGTAPLGTPHKRARVSPSPSPEVTPTRSRADAAPATSPCVIEATPGSPPWTQSGGRTARLAPGTPPVGLASPGMSPIGERSGSQLGRLSSSSGEHENIVGGCGARRASRTIPRTFAGEPWSMSFGDDAAAAPRGEDEARQGDESASAWEDVRTGSQGKDGRRRRGLRGAVPRILFPIEEQGGGGGEGQSKAEVHIGDMEGPPDAPTPRLFGGATATRGFDAPSAGPDSEISAGLRVGGMEGQVEDVVGALDEVLERMGGWQVSEQRAASDGGTGARTSSLSGSDGREADGEAEHDKPGGEKTPVSAVGPGSADVTPPTTGYQARISGPGRGFDGPMSEDGGDSVGGGMEGGAAVQSGFGWWAHTTDMPPQCSEVEVDGKNEEGGRERGEPGVHAGNDTSDTPGKANFGGNAGNVGSAPDCHEGAQDAEQEAARYREGQIGNSGGHGRHPMPFCTCHHCQTCGGVVVPHVFVGAWGSGGQFVTSMGQAARAGDAQQWESWGFQKEREESMGGRRAREGHKQGPRKRGGTDRAAAEDNGGREGVGAWSRAKDGGSVAGGKPIWDFLTQMEMDILFGPRGSGARRSGEDMQQTQARDFNVDPKFTSWRTKYMAYIKTDG